jgi:hypothetical protein
MSRLRADIVVNKNADGPFLAGQGINVESGQPILFNNSTAKIEEDSNNLKITGGIASTGGWKGTTSTAGVLGGVPIAFTGGRNDNAYSLSINDTLNFGGSDYYSSSNNSQGPLMPFSGKLLYATIVIYSWSYNGYNVTLDLIKNGSTLVSNAFNVTYAGSTTAYSTFDARSSPYTFNAYDRLNFRFTGSISSISMGQVICTFYVVFD